MRTNVLLDLARAGVFKHSGPLSNSEQAKENSKAKFISKRIGTPEVQGG